MRGMKTSVFSRNLAKKAKVYKPLSVKAAESRLANDYVKTKKKVARLAKQVGADIRYQDDQESAQSISTVGAFYLLNGMAPGDSNGNRDGTTIEIKSVEVRGTFTVADTVNVCRVLLVYDKQSDTAAPSVSTLLSVTGDPRANYNWIHRNRYKILADRTLVASTNGPEIVKFHIRSFKKLKTYYELTSNGDITDISKGSLYLFFISDSGAATHPTVDFNWRIVYQP